MPEDFRETKEARIREIADHLERSGVNRSDAVRAAEKRLERAMPNVVRHQEREGKSRPIEIRSK